MANIDKHYWETNAENRRIDTKISMSRWEMIEGSFSRIMARKYADPDEGILYYIFVQPPFQYAERETHSL